MNVPYLSVNYLSMPTHADVQRLLTLPQYVSHPHVFCSLGGTTGSTLEWVVDEALKRSRLTRTIGARVSSTLASTGFGRSV